MSEIVKKRVKLYPITLKCYDTNPIPFSAVPKRKATQREALHILKNILGFNLDLSFDDAMDAEEVADLKKEFTDALNDFLNGGDWCCLCDACYCYDDTDAVNFACFLWMVSYCQEKGIL